MPFDRDELTQAVFEDVIQGLGGEAGLNEELLAGSFSVLDELDTPVLLDEEGVVGAVAWKASTVQDGLFQGLPASGLPVEITGCTYVVGDELNDATYVRFVDWASVLGQLGVTFNTKVHR